MQRMRGIGQPGVLGAPQVPNAVGQVPGGMGQVLHSGGPLPGQMPGVNFGGVQVQNPMMPRIPGRGIVSGGASVQGGPMDGGMGNMPAPLSGARGPQMSQMPGQMPAMGSMGMQGMQGPGAGPYAGGQMGFPPVVQQGQMGMSSYGGAGAPGGLGPPV
eukprot:evm.model.scf_4305.2 EVM.evm.TU.scf_4305.2   scf_4305:6266-7201(-)